ncbi:hypothetical protein [Neobacillus dielmonensis]|uniref:hypothetical protein n=1 Tax=Neobacillus dielmonensis TaxID=1347369 RepID=UPI0005AB8929|nr:hypothetical protein [Neobacillus dielmonensis]
MSSMKHIIQFCNTYTQEILREESYENFKRIEEIITGLSNAVGEIYILDSSMRMHVAAYVTDKIIVTDREFIYKVFFKTKLCELQPMVRR